MKAFYDKIILLIGVLALAGGAAFFVTQKGGDSADNPLLKQQPSGASYDMIAPPKMPEVDSAWPEPTPQDEKGYELYDVFTPPKIWWLAKEQRFDFEPPAPPDAEIPFGLALRAINRELYRIQMEAFFGRGDDALAQIYDTVTEQSYRGKVGTKFPEIETEIMNIDDELVSKPDGTMTRVQRVTLLDGGSGEVIMLGLDERKYVPNKFDIEMAVVRPYPTEDFVWKKANETHAVGKVTFNLVDFDFDNQTATVEKTDPDNENETEILVATASPTAQASLPESEPEDQVTSEESSPSGEISEDFESLFQN